MRGLAQSAYSSAAPRLVLGAGLPALPTILLCCHGQVPEIRYVSEHSLARGTQGWLCSLLHLNQEHSQVWVPPEHSWFQAGGEGV